MKCLGRRSPDAGHYCLWNALQCWGGAVGFISKDLFLILSKSPDTLWPRCRGQVDSATFQCFWVDISLKVSIHQLSMTMYWTLHLIFLSKSPMLGGETKSRKDHTTWGRAQSYLMADSGPQPRSLWLCSLSTILSLLLGHEWKPAAAVGSELERFCLASTTKEAYTESTENWVFNWARHYLCLKSATS
jgi:hypothetical protein